MKKIASFVLQNFTLKALLRCAKKALEPRGIFRARCCPEDNTQVFLFSDSPGEFSSYQPRFDLSNTIPLEQARVSLIATTHNEKASLPGWFESILQGERLPDEIVVADCGSTDGTAELLAELARKSPLPFNVITRDSGSIALGRNLAISTARYELIAVTDLGCRVHPNWLKKLIQPFELDSRIEVSAGFFRAIGNRGQPVVRLRWPRLDQVDPQDFLPSSRSLAFKKTAWERIGGYPEWVSRTGEDTYFALGLKRLTQWWAFVPDATVDWLAPEGILGYWRKQAYWSFGDGEIGLHARYYWRTALQFGLFFLSLLVLGFTLIIGSILAPWLLFLGLLGLLTAGLIAVYITLRQAGLSLGDFIVESGAKIAQLDGFVRGAKNRQNCDLLRQAKLAGIVYILSLVPIDDTGGGSRAAQIGREMLRCNYLVVFLNKYPKYEIADLGLNICHPNLHLQSIPAFSINKFTERLNPILTEKKSVVLIEFPSRDTLSLGTRLQQAGAVAIYDLLDDWDSSLGGDWYSTEIERQIIAQSDEIIATAPVLQRRLASMTPKQVHLLPNAVNRRLFNPERSYPRPLDLPGDNHPVLLYIGALWGEWFDWDLVLEIARHDPANQLVLIGDYRSQVRQPPPNLHFLGLKPQTSLPAYLAHSAITIVPWKSTSITQATSPLKIYEYLAMHKPVVAPDLAPLREIEVPYIFLSGNQDEFLANIKRSLETDVDPQVLEPFLSQNSWQSRADKIIDIIEKSAR